MAASNSTNGQRSGETIESLQNPAPQVVPSLPNSGNEDEESREAGTPEGTASEDETHEDVETSELPANEEPAHFVAELAAVSPEDLDHEMPDYEPEKDSSDASVSEESTDGDGDVVMEDAPPLEEESEEESVDTSVPEGTESTDCDGDVVMPNAPPLEEEEE